jgi:hypothetical protein
MISDLWWNNKCRRYADKIDKEFDGFDKVTKTYRQLQRVQEELYKTSKTLVDGYALDYLVELDGRLDDGEYTTKATKLIRKAIS